MWIVGLLPPDGSSSVPEPVRVAFCCFSSAVFSTIETLAATLHLMKVGCRITRFSHQALPGLISQSGGTSEMRRY